VGVGAVNVYVFLLTYLGWRTNSVDEMLSLRWVGNGGLQIGGEGRKCAAAGADNLRGCSGESCLVYSCST